MHYCAHVLSFSSKMGLLDTLLGKGGNVGGGGRKFHPAALCRIIQQALVVIQGSPKGKAIQGTEKSRKIRLPSYRQFTNREATNLGSGRAASCGNLRWRHCHIERKKSLPDRGLVCPTIRVSIYLASLLAKNFAGRYPCVISYNSPNFSLLPLVLSSKVDYKESWEQEPCLFFLIILLLNILSKHHSTGHNTGRNTQHWWIHSSSQGFSSLLQKASPSASNLQQLHCLVLALNLRFFCSLCEEFLFHLSLTAITYFKAMDLSG